MCAKQNAFGISKLTTTLLGICKLTMTLLGICITVLNLTVFHNATV